MIYIILHIKKKKKKKQLVLDPGLASTVIDLSVMVWRVWFDSCKKSVGVCVTLLCERELGQCGKRLTSEGEICCVCTCEVCIPRRENIKKKSI